MPVNIKNRQTEALLAEIKAATGKGTSQIVLELVQKEVGRLRRQRQVEERRHSIEALARRYSARLLAHPVALDEIVGYDEHGLPT